MVQEPVYTPHVATNLQAHTVTQLCGGQHHTLALTQVLHLQVWQVLYTQ